MSSKDSKDSGSALFHFAFTWNGPTKDDAKDVIDEWKDRDLKTLIATLKTYAAHYMFQLECGAETGRFHYQGYLHLKKKMRIPQLAKLLQATVPTIHLSPSHDHEALKSYCMKKDLTYVAGPWDDRDSEGHDVDVLAKEDLYPWQIEVLRQCSVKPDDRKVCWLVDQKGCSGKTALLKFMRKHKMALPLSYTDSKDAMYMVTQLPWQEAYVFDLTRVKPASLSASDLYAVMEQIKNGLLQNTKYVSKAGILRKPSHVWVFANHVPDYKSLSQDRWMVYEINENKNLIGFDKARFQYESKKRHFVRQVEDLREAKRRKVEKEAIDEAAAAEDSDASAAAEAYLGPPPSPSSNAEV